MKRHSVLLQVAVTDVKDTPHIVVVTLGADSQGWELSGNKLLQLYPILSLSQLPNLTHNPRAYRSQDGLLRIVIACATLWVILRRFLFLNAVVSPGHCSEAGTTGSSFALTPSPPLPFISSWRLPVASIWEAHYPAPF